MGKMIDKETGKVLAEFTTEEDGIELKKQAKAQGLHVKMEW